MWPTEWLVCVYESMCNKAVCASTLTNTHQLFAHPLTTTNRAICAYTTTTHQLFLHPHWQTQIKLCVHPVHTDSQVKQAHPSPGASILWQTQTNICAQSTPTHKSSSCASLPAKYKSSQVQVHTDNKAEIDLCAHPYWQANQTEGIDT